MYNRYIPQPDGSYRKSRMQEPQHHEPQRRSKPTPQPFQPPPAKESKRPPERCAKSPQHESGGIMDFFKKLLPRELDTGDLMIILLLLLMAGDCDDEKNTALLTLALYFFM